MAGSCVNIFSAFCESVNRHNQRVAVITESDSVSFDDLLVGSLKIAGYFRRTRTDGEERVGLLAANSIPFLESFYGVLGADLEVIPFNCMLAPAELALQVRHAGITRLLTSGTLEPLARAAAAQVETGVEVVLIEPLLRDESPAPVKPSDIERSDDDTAIMLYTSGTTGQPKGVMLTHRNLLSNCNTFTRLLEFNEKDNCICVLPFFHSFALTVYGLGGILSGATTRLVSRFQPRSVLETLREYPNGVFTAVPSQFSLLAQAAGDNAEPLNNLRVVVSGGAALLPEIQKAFESRLGVKILQGYGLTETSPVVACNRPGNNIDGTIGPPLDGVEVAIRDDNGVDLPRGEVGELAVRGDNVMKGYFRNPEATREVLKEGWLHTGDMASIDENGHIRIAGRKKEMIISAGENIYPAEVENVLLEHERIAEVAVVGIPHPLKGEVPKAFIVPQSDVVPEIGEIRRYCRERLASYKVPSEFEILSELPKSPSGKILKKKLLESSPGRV